MDRVVDLQPHDAVGFESVPMETFAEEFDRLIREDDGSAADEILASGQPIYIGHHDTPKGYVVRVNPDRREEMIKIDWTDIARLIG